MSEEVNRNTFVYAASTGDFDTIRRYVENGTYSVDINDDDGIAPVCYAANQCNWEILEYLINKGAKLVESPGFWGVYDRAIEGTGPFSNDTWNKPMPDRLKTKLLDKLG